MDENGIAPWWKDVFADDFWAAVPSMVVAGEPGSAPDLPAPVSLPGPAAAEEEPAKRDTSISWQQLGTALALGWSAWLAALRRPKAGTHNIEFARSGAFSGRA